MRLGQRRNQAAKPNVGPNAVTVGKRTIRLPLFSPVCHELFDTGEPMEIMQTPGRVVMLYDRSFVRRFTPMGVSIKI